MTQIVRETKYHPVINGGKISLGSKKSSDVRFSASNLKKVTKKTRIRMFFGRRMLTPGPLNKTAMTN